MEPLRERIPLLIEDHYDKYRASQHMPHDIFMARLTDAILALFAEERLGWDEERQTLGEGIDHWRRRAEKAEASHDALREALEVYKGFYDTLSGCSWWAASDGKNEDAVKLAMKKIAALPKEEPK